MSDKRRQVSIEEAALRKFKVAIVDDGLQVYSFDYNLKIVCFDKKNFIGNGFLIPSGPLREKLKAVLRANCVVINGNKNIEFENELKTIAGNKELPIFYSEYKIKNLKEFSKKS